MRIRLFLRVFSVPLCLCGSLFNTCFLCWSGRLFRDEEFVIGLCHVARRSDVAARSEPRPPIMRIRLFLRVFTVPCGYLPLSTMRRSLFGLFCILAIFFCLAFLLDQQSVDSGAVHVDDFDTEFVPVQDISDMRWTL